MEIYSVKMMRITFWDYGSALGRAFLLLEVLAFLFKFHDFSLDVFFEIQLVDELVELPVKVGNEKIYFLWLGVASLLKMM